MNNQAHVINSSGDYEETILRLAKHLGRDKTRRAVFMLMYGRISKPRSKKQIADKLGRSGSSQVVQNALDELAKHHLIVRLENNGQTEDGARWVYKKDDFVRANCKKIVRYADDPAAAKKVPTKRRPEIDAKMSFVEPVRQITKSPDGRRLRPKAPAKLKIAVLMTNPDMQASIKTAVEARDIEQSVRQGTKGADIDVKFLAAATLDTLLDTLNSYRPDIIHFSGHGGGGTLLFDNERAGDDGGTVLDFDLVARVVEATSAAPKLLVLVACDTSDGAQRFLNAVPAVVAMSDSIDDEAACEFSRRFYRSLSDGATIANSLTQSKLTLESKGYADAKLPILLARDESASKITLV